ncbi:ubiquitin carboxyl-terminal hydrolase 17-like protein B isoform X2 [Gouania willdenowi]|uniref:ubiquitin carboxyl-terminal hydrolase 17-like protein B isoform X2 n=1 Tax=Gouania willdenowi TaxID=441366 RepID=UPI0010541703|nr:ubiquitin carboxyl-terminal hydrolase 17-like protein B isoform X2 [Gouania willdenowi]
MVLLNWSQVDLLLLLIILILIILYCIQIPAVRMEDKWRQSSIAIEELHGLVNQGSTCYLNSVLQILFWTQPYRDAVTSHSNDSDFIDVQLAVLFNKLKKHTGTTVDVTRKLGILRVNQQQDSAEHFEKILSLSSPEASKVFRGLLVHKTVCHGCQKETGSEGNFWHLPLPLVNVHSKDFSVIEGMQEFFRSSEFSGDNQVYCEGCDSKQDAIVVCEMKCFPDVLTLLLKRFEFSYKFMSFTKNNRAVDIPHLLNIPQLQGERYELFAFIDHSGTLKSGHYTATIKCLQGNNQRWFTFNDRSVYQHSFLQRNSNYHQVENDNVMLKSQSAYLLFYQRKTHVTNDNIKLHEVKEDHAEDEKQTQICKRVKRERENGVMKEEEHMHMDDRKRKTASKKAQVEVKADVIAERNNVVEEPRKEKDGKTNRAMWRSQEDERKERLEMEDYSREREMRQEHDIPKTNLKEKEAQIHEEKLEIRKEEHVHMDDRKRNPASKKAQVVRADVIAERNNVVEEPRKEKDGKTNRAMLRSQEDERKEWLEMKDYGRIREIRNLKVKEAQVHEEKLEMRKELASEKSYRSDAVKTSPEPKRQESKDQDEGERRNQKSGSDRQTERKRRQDQEARLEPLQEDIGNPSGSTTNRNRSKSNGAKIRKWFKRKKDKSKKKQKGIKCLFCMSKANRGSFD